MELQVQKREILGRKVGASRKAGFIPAEIYGKGLENIHIGVSAKEFRKVFKEAGETTIINLILDGQKYPVLVQDIKYHPVKNGVEQVDFYRVRMDEKLKVGVPLEFIGVALGVKEKGGIFVKALQQIEVEALPAEIPHTLKVDISKLDDVGKSIYVKDLDVSPNVKLLVDLGTVVATITAKVTEEEELAMQQAAGGKAEEVKVETEEKKAERVAESAAAASEKSAETPAKKAPEKK